MAGLMASIDSIKFVIALTPEPSQPYTSNTTVREPMLFSIARLVVMSLFIIYGPAESCRW